MAPAVADAPGPPHGEARAAAASAARDCYGRVLALLAAPTSDIAAAEDALADALERALRTWPEEGVPRSPEAWLLTVARAKARRGPDGTFVPLAEQDTRLWSTALVERGRAHLRRAHATGTIGRCSLEAGIQAVHVARRDTGRTDWHALLELHRAAHELTPTLGSAAALAAVTAEIDGPQSGLEVLDALGERARRSQPAWATRAHLLDRSGRPEEAVTAFDTAISLTSDPAERRHLEGRRDGLS